MMHANGQKVNITSQDGLVAIKGARLQMMSHYKQRGDLRLLENRFGLQADPGNLVQEGDMQSECMNSDIHYVQNICSVISL